MSVLDTKNLTPRLLSSITALIISSANVILSLFIPQLAWYMPLVVFVVTFAITYTIYYYTLQRFIYRKIKLIYKFIYQTKATKKEEFFYNSILPQKSIEEVSQDVQKWTSQKKDEVETSGK